MSVADDIYEARQMERRARAEKRRELEKLLHDEAVKGSRRYLRARQFSDQVLALVRDFIPEACWGEAHETVMRNAIGIDVEIVQVPPERDAEHDLALRAAEATLRPATIIKTP